MSISRTIRFKADVYDFIMKRAIQENRNFNNMVETMLIEMFKNEITNHSDREGLKPN